MGCRDCKQITWWKIGEEGLPKRGQWIWGVVGLPRAAVQARIKTRGRTDKLTCWYYARQFFGQSRGCTRQQK